MAIAHSLFDTTDSQTIENAGAWVSDTLSGTLAVSLCVLAVAIIGLLMLTGRLPVRDAIRVVLGCSILLGAQTIVAGITGVLDTAAPASQATAVSIPVQPTPSPLPPANYDPYAGASLMEN